MDEPTYEVDEDTRELLTEVLSLAQRVIDLQYDDDTADSLEDMLITLSNRFGIESHTCLLYTSPSPRDATLSRMPSSA